MSTDYYPQRKRISKAERRQVYEKYGGHCAYCGCELDIRDMQGDHIKSVYQRGESVLENYNPACRMCNFYKSTYSVEFLRQRIASIPAKLKERQFIYRMAVKYGLVVEQDKPVQFYFEREI